jgi:hypothetical protein
MTTIHGLVTRRVARWFNWGPAHEPQDVSEPSLVATTQRAAGKRDVSRAP